MENIVIQTTALDNVGIVANSSGLEKGMVVSGGIVLQEDIPMGHKVALTSFEKDEAIVRYGQTIGYAKTPIAKGCRVNEGNINLPQPPDLNELTYTKTNY
jgi:galactarate dehydratase